MKHNLKISVSKTPQRHGMATCKSVSIREKLLRHILGEKRKLFVVIPGECVKEISINKVEKGETLNNEILS